MKKLILILFLGSTSLVSFAQSTVQTIRIANATTVMAVDIPVGTMVVDVATKNLYIATAGVAKTFTITTGLAEDTPLFLLVNGSVSGFILPSLVNTAAVTAPVNGMIIYDLSSTCTKTYENNAWTDCLSSAGAGATSPVVSDCDVNGFAGTFINGVALSGTSFSVTITNNSFSTVVISMVSDDLVLSGVSGITVNAPTPASVTLTAGQSQLITYALSGTPESKGNLSGTWSKLSLTCTKTKVISNGDATFTLPQSATVVSILDGTAPVVDIQGIVDNGSNQLTVNVPYTAGQGSYDAYTSLVVTSEAGTGEAGDTNGFSLTYPAGTFNTTGAIPLTITVDGDGTFNAKKQLFGTIATIASIDFQVNGDSKGNVKLNIVGGLLNTNFMAVENGAKYAISGANANGMNTVVQEFGPAPYIGPFGAANSAYQAGGAFYYDNGTSKTRPTVKSAAAATTWYEPTNSDGAAYIIVDYGAQRIINTIYAHQTNADGRFTSIEVAVATSALDANDPGWTVVKPFVTDEVSCLFDSAGTKLRFPAAVTQFARYRFKNSGTCSASGYIEVFAIGTFLDFD